MAAVLGDPVRHSLSPVIHNAAFAELDLDWSFVALQVAPEALTDAVAGVRALGLGGLSVTMPHKEAILPLLDGLDGTAATLGAVNCVQVDDGRLVGHNTDGRGFVAGLRAETGAEVAGRRCVVLGSGGAARAVAHALAGSGAGDVAVVSRKPARAAPVVEGLGAGIRLGSPDDLAGADLVVNATPVGMAAHPGLPVDPVALGQATVVVDLIYHPQETALLAAARERGLTATNGLAMLVHQAAAAFELWTGRAAPLDTMGTAVSGFLAAD